MRREALLSVALHRLMTKDGTMIYLSGRDASRASMFDTVDTNVANVNNQMRLVSSPLHFREAINNHGICRDVAQDSDVQ